MRSGVSQSLDAENYVMDYAVLDVFDREGGRFCKVQVYLAGRKLVDFASDIISMSGKKPFSYQVAENALYSLHRVVGGLIGKDIILTSLGSKGVNVALLTGKANVVMRSASTMPDAEAFSAVKSGLFQTGPLTDMASEQISKMMQYMMIKEPGKKVENIFVLGDYASKDMAERISRQLGERVGMLPMPGNVIAPPGFELGKYAHAVGALIEK